MSLKCPFAAPLTTGRFACHHAQEVVRRGGSEYDCRSQADHGLCTALFAGLKAQALPAFGVEDDLTTMPHSVGVKVQSGGLLGLRRLLEERPAGGEIDDIASLVGRVMERFGSPDGVPYAEIEGDMTAFRLERRSGRR
jgi:hypothetical protein